MTSLNPLVSIIIPTFNSAKYIEETLNSVFKQTFKNYEIIIVDDGSEDETVKIVNNLKSEKIRIIKAEHSGQPAISRNIGIKSAKGFYIAFLDSDDLWHKNKLKEQLKVFSKFQEAVLVYSMSLTKGVSIFSSAFELLPLPFKAARNFKDLIDKGNSITTSTVLVKRDSASSIGGFDEDPSNKMEDYALWLDLANKNPIVFIPKIHCYYRIHDNQFSGNFSQKIERLEYLSKKKNLPLKKYNMFRTKSFFHKTARNLIHTFFALLYLIKSNLFLYDS